MNDYKIATKASDIFKAIDHNNNCVSIALKKFNTSENYGYKLMKDFEEIGLLEYYDTEGRRKYFKLTEKGEEVKKNLIIIQKSLSQRRGKKGL